MKNARYFLWGFFGVICVIISLPYQMFVQPAQFIDFGREVEIDVKQWVKKGLRQ